MVGIATVNYPPGQPDCNGHSSAFDGIAYKSENSSSSDMLIVDAGEAGNTPEIMRLLEKHPVYRTNGQ